MRSVVTLVGTKGPFTRSAAVVVSALWVAFVALDVAAYLGGGVSPYTLYLKGLASLSCAAIAWAAWKGGGRAAADLLRAVGFTFAFLGDVPVLLNTYRILSAPIVFAVGGYLFIPALLLISARNGALLAYLAERRAPAFREVAFALAFYLPFIILLVVLAEGLAEVGLLGLGIVYGLCLVSVLWTGWAAKRSGRWTPPRGAMIAAGATLVFAMEMIGLAYNLRVSGLRDIAFFATWILYVPGMLLLALA